MEMLGEPKKNMVCAFWLILLFTEFYTADYGLNSWYLLWRVDFMVLLSVYQPMCFDFEC